MGTLHFSDEKLPLLKQEAMILDYVKESSLGILFKELDYRNHVSKPCKWKLELIQMIVNIFVLSGIIFIIPLIINYLTK